MSPRARAALAALVALAAPLAARPAAAQSSADFGLCLLGPFQACTQLHLVTTPNGAGTDVDVLLRHTTLGAAPSAVQGFSFLFSGIGGAGDAAPLVPALDAVGSAAAAPADVAWRALALDGALLLQDASPLGAAIPDAVQYVAGCAGALPGGLVATPLATCGGAYRFRFATAALLDAAGVTGFSLDVNAGLLDPLGLPTVLSCDVGDGRANACLDFSNLVDPVVPFRLVPVSAVPEPGVAALLALGLGALAAVVRRRPLTHS